VALVWPEMMRSRISRREANGSTLLCLTVWINEAVTA
jgi:hypothetical protein